MSEFTEAYPVKIDLRLNTEGLLEMLRALGTPPSGNNDVTAETGLEDALLAWGFGTNLGSPYRRADATTVDIGMYGDWFWLEDLAVVMPALAPFAQRYSEFAYTLSRYFGQNDDRCWRWYFDAGRVRHFAGNLEWEFGWDRDEVEVPTP